MIPESKTGAIVFILNDNNEVLLYRRINTWYQPNKLALIGGNVDPGESPKDAVVRETLEETSLTINSIEHLTTSLEDNYEVHYFISRDWAGTPSNTEPDRCGGLSWHKLNNLPDDTIEKIKELVKTHVAFR